MPRQDGYYTLARWEVEPGKADAFVAAWERMGAAFLAIPDGTPGSGTLVRSLDDPNVFYSFGSWPDLEAIRRMRADASAQAAMAEVLALCTDARPGAYEVVSRVPA